MRIPELTLKILEHRNLHVQLIPFIQNLEQLLSSPTPSGGPPDSHKLYILT